MQHIPFDLGDYAGGGRIEVSLQGSTCRLFLIDVDEYQAYLDGAEYEFFGDFTDVSPVELEVPYDHHWFLVVDSFPDSVSVEWTPLID